MRPLRPLLPDVDESRKRQLPAEPTPKRRKVAQACDACRERKAKVGPVSHVQGALKLIDLQCNGVRPICDTCNRSSTACTYSQVGIRHIRQRYEELQKRESTHEELVELLRNVSEQDAIAIVSRLRAGMSAASILSQARDGDLLIQLALAPANRRLYEFPHRLDMPGHVFVADNVYLDSLLYKAISSCWALPYNASNRGKTSRQSDANRQSSLGELGSGGDRRQVAQSATYRSAYLVPYHAAHMAEPLLEKLTTTPWTRVISDDKLFRRLISAYFYYPHPWGPFVHKDLFLEDMAAGRTRFCSPLLVNAMLAVGVVRTATNWNKTALM